MRPHAFTVALAAGFCACAGLLRDVPVARGADPPRGDDAAFDAEVQVVATPRQLFAHASDIGVVRVSGRGSRTTAWATLEHAPGAVVRGDVSPDGRSVVVAADLGDVPPSDWSSGLWRIEPNAPPVLLARGLYHASRPLASVDGRIYVQKGAAGAWPTVDEARAGRLRVDRLWLDAIDPVTRTARTFYSWSGYTLHLAGEIDGDVVVYRVGPDGADLVRIDRATGRSRAAATILPFARDFSIDPTRRAIAFSNRHEIDTRTWVVDRVDLETGARTRLAVSTREPTPLEVSAFGGMRRGTR
jgi:hypothetical protein